MMKATGNVTRRGNAPILMGLIALPLALAVVACEKDEPPPPLPSAAPAASPPATVDLQIVEEDAEVDAEEPKKTGGSGRPASSLSNCCAALSQNAENAPEPNKSYMKTAATVCRSAVAAGQTQGAALAAIRAALQTAGMPSACR